MRGHTERRDGVGGWREARRRGGDRERRDSVGVAAADEEPEPRTRSRPRSTPMRLSGAFEPLMFDQAMVTAGYEAVLDIFT